MAQEATAQVGAVQARVEALQEVLADDPAAVSGARGGHLTAAGEAAIAAS